MSTACRCAALVRRLFALRGCRPYDLRTNPSRQRTAARIAGFETDPGSAVEFGHRSPELDRCPRGFFTGFFAGSFPGTTCFGGPSTLAFWSRWEMTGPAMQSPEVA